MSSSKALSPITSLACIVALALPGAAFPALAGGPCELVHDPGVEWIVRTPLEVIDGRIYVEADVNGAGPFRFAVDTGASGMGRADSSLVARLGLAVHAQAENSDGVTRSSADVTRLDSVRLQGLVRRDLDVLARDYAGNKPAEEKFSGILAREFFGDGLLVIDYPNRTLSFAHAPALQPGQAGVLAYERAFRIPVSIGDFDTTGNLDTGANVAFVLPAAMHARLGGLAPERAGTGTLSNTQVRADRTMMHGPFRIGGLVITDVEVRVSDRFPELLVGAHALQQAAVVIDQRSRSVLLCPAPTTPDS